MIRIGWSGRGGSHSGPRFAASYVVMTLLKHNEDITPILCHLYTPSKAISHLRVRHFLIPFFFVISILSFFSLFSIFIFYFFYFHHYYFLNFYYFFFTFTRSFFLFFLFLSLVQLFVLSFYKFQLRLNVVDSLIKPLRVVLHV